MCEESATLIPESIESPEEAASNDSGSLVVSKDLMPESILIFPLYDRPMFPKMMGPLIIDNPKMQEIILESHEQSKPMYLGLLLIRPTEDTLQHVPETPADFFTVGVAV